jgi:hypothetical protein
MEKQEVISFRLAARDFSELKNRAEASGVSPGAFVRVFVLDMLNRTHTGGELEVAGQFQDLLESHMATLVTKHDLATAVSALLIAVGIEHDRAQEWVKTHLLVRGGAP